MLMLQVDQFLYHFRSQIPLIESVDNLTYRKLLYATALEPLARAAFGKNEGHRSRIVRFIDELTSWSAKDRISLPQASLCLLEHKRGRYRLYRKIKQDLSLWAPGHIITLDASPRLSEYANIATQEESKLIAKIRYAELFYTYRNNLIHEFREPGYGIEMSSDGTQPYYTSMIDGPWQLVFPVGFFKELFGDALVGLEQYLKHHKINPYKQFEFGSIWREK